MRQQQKRKEMRDDLQSSMIRKATTHKTVCSVLWVFDEENCLAVDRRRHRSDNNLKEVQCCSCAGRMNSIPNPPRALCPRPRHVQISRSFVLSAVDLPNTRPFEFVPYGKEWPEGRGRAFTCDGLVKGGGTGDHVMQLSHWNGNTTAARCLSSASPHTGILWWCGGG